MDGMDKDDMSRVQYRGVVQAGCTAVGRVGDPWSTTECSEQAQAEFREKSSCWAWHGLMD
jgi:hypothetical protein